MDKQSFINLAPEYYMLALYIHLQQPAEYYTDMGWQKDFSYYDDEVQEEYCYVGHKALRDEAIRLLYEQGAITVIQDPFGPTIWQKTATLEDLSDQLEASEASVFFRARASGDPKAWLYAALRKLNEVADELKVTSADFQQTPTSELTASAEATDPIDEWSPITIDQTDPIVAEATKQLGEVTEAIEQDNGYSVSHPQERDAVVGNLQAGLEKMKTGVVSIGWMRRIIWALRQASDRFVNTVKGQAIDGALAAVKDVVKAHMSHALEHLTSLWPF